MTRLRKTSLNYFINHVLQFSHKIMQRKQRRAEKGIITSRESLGGELQRKQNFIASFLFGHVRWTVFIF